MIKNFKKCLALLLSVIMVLAMSISVFADETTPADPADPSAATTSYSLTINVQNKHDTDVEYNIYQLFVADIAPNGAPTYTMDGAANSSVLPEGTTVETVAGYSDNQKELYELAANSINFGVSPFGTLKTGNTLSNIPAGYYLAVPTNVASTSDTDSDKLANEGGRVSAPILVAVPDVDYDTKTKEYKVTDAVKVDAKISDVTHEKKITAVDSTFGTDDTIGTSKDTAGAGQDDLITYTLTNTVPKYEKDVDPTKVNYYITDNYDENLELVKDDKGVPAITVKVGNVTYSYANGEPTPTTVAKTNGTTHTVYTTGEANTFKVVETENSTEFKVYVNYNDIKDAESVVVTAQFKLKDTAVVGTAVENTSKLTYTNNYHTGTDSDLEDKVKNFTYKFNIFKYDGTSKVALKGAKFGLFKTDTAATAADENTEADANNVIAVAESDENGVVDFGKKLNEGTYYVKELVAPDGYKLSDTVYTLTITDKGTGEAEYDGTFTVMNGSQTLATEVKDGENVLYTSADNKTPVMGIANTAGQVLPGTGGIGTTIFTFGGLALVILAAAMFIVYMKKQKRQA